MAEHDAKATEETRARLAALVDSSDDAIIAVGQDGFITDWNRGAERIYGYCASEMVGAHLSVLAPPGDHDEVSGILKRVMEGELVEHFETVHLRKDGSTVSVSLTVSPILGDEGNIIAVSAIARDITRRKLAEEALRKSEESLNVAMDAVGVGCCDMDTRTGRGLWSRQHFLLLGYPAPEGYHAPATIPMWQGCIHQDDAEGVLAALTSAQQRRALFSSEHRLVRVDDGAVVWVEVLGRFLPAHGVEAATRFIGVIQDITRRKEAEREVALARTVAEHEAREAEEGQKILEALMEHIPEGLAVSICGDEECRLHLISRDGLEMLGIDRDSLRQLTPQQRIERLGMTRADGITPLIPEELPAVRALMQGEVIKDLELFMRGAGGRVIPVLANAGPIRDKDGTITGSVVSWRDVTAWKEMQQKLKESEERYRTLVEWAPDAVIVHRDGRFLYVNCPALGIFGARTREELHDRNFFDLVHPEDRKLVRQQMQQIKDGEKMSPYEFRFLKGTEAVLVEAAGIIVMYEGAPAYLFIVRDITERKRLEEERLWAVEELRVREQLLIKQGRFAAMGEMIGNIAHQWRQPLNNLGLIVQELPVYYKMGQFNKEYLESSVDKAMQVIFHMSQTIDGFRNFFKPDKASTTFQVKEVLEKTVSMVEATFAALKLQMEIVAEEGVELWGYPNEYSQVILNILMNAKDAFLERQVTKPRVEVRLFREQGMVVVTVTDNAGGIPEEIMGKIFDPYFSTKSFEKGTGIGLFMSRTIIEKHMGGALSARNVPHGAQFRVEVPECGGDMTTPFGSSNP